MTTNAQLPKALVVLKNPQRAKPVVSLCMRKGISATLFENPEKALEHCRAETPDLAIVEDDLGSISGPKFIAELLALSWMVNSIIITPDDEETVHEKTEGLGILGHVSDPADVNDLDALVNRFLSMRPPAVEADA